MAQNAPIRRNSGYGEEGASWYKRALKAFFAISGSPISDIDAHNQTLRERSRILYMGAPLATSAVKTVRTNVIGLGLYPKPRPDAVDLGMTAEEANEWGERAAKEFRLWAQSKESCDATGMNNFYELQQLAMLGWLMSGDVFALVKRHEPTWASPYSLRLHLIEADRVSTPMEWVGGWKQPGTDTEGTNPDNGNDIHDGVEVDGTGTVVAYHICNTYPTEPTTADREWVRVELTGQNSGMANILHLMESERPDQYRGTPFLSQVIEPLKQLDRYTGAELSAAVIESFFTAFIKTENPEDMPEETGGEEPVDGIGGSMVSDGSDVSQRKNEYEMGPGTINTMLPGEDIVFADPKRPSSGFEPFVRTMATQVGAALEIPADLLLKSFNASYSASRAALLEAWSMIRMRRRWFINDFCNPVWELWMTEAVALGRIEAPGFFSDPIIRRAYLACEWVGPSQGQLDPTKEVAAEVQAIQEGLSTRQAAAQRLNGSDFDENVQRLKLESDELRQISEVRRAVSELSPDTAEGDTATVDGYESRDR